MFMSNFTQDERPACSSSFVMNLMSCCSKSLGQAKNNMLSFVLPMFLLFSVSLLQAQKLQTDQERSIFYEVCLADAPEGFTEEQVEEMVEAAFDCSKLQVTKTIVTEGDDCFWESFHTFEIVGFDECAGITDIIKYYYNGGDRTAPVLTGTIPPSIDNMNLCFDQIPPGPPEGFIASLFEDDCGAVNVMKSGEPSGDNCGWEVTYTYVIMDDCENVVEPEVKISYSGRDDSAPTLISGSEIPQGETGLNQCFLDKEQGPTVEEIAALFTDNCSTITPENVTKESNSKGTDCKWLAVYTYTVTDDCDNVYGPFEIMYSGGDYENPVLEEAPGNMTISCIDELGAIPSLNWTDNCSGEGTVAGVPDFSGLGLPCEDGEVVIRWNYTDACMNPADERVQVITVTAAPQAQFPELSDEDILCENLDNYVPQTVIVSNGVEAGPCVISAEVTGVPEAFDANCGSFVVNFTYTDLCGRESTASYTVNVIDVTPPTIEAGADFKVECPDEWAFDTPEFGDNCDENPTLVVVSTDEDLDECGLGTVTRTWKVTDSCGNTATDSQTVFIEDNTDPTITPGDALTVECDAEIVWTEPTIADTCDDKPELTIVSTIENLDEDCYTGTVTRTWKVTDCAGNSATASQTATIVDNTDPTITPGGPLTFECDAELVFTTPEFADNCDENPVLSIVSTEENIDEGCYTGTVTRTWKVTDCAGNTATASQTATIVDTTNPTIVAGNAFKVECPDEYEFDTPEFGDNCDENPVLSIVSTIESLDACGLGSITRTWKVTDCAGNTATDSQTVEIEDLTDPIIEVADGFTVECPDEWSFNDPTFSDTCDDKPELTIVSTVEDLDECDLGTVTRTWKVTDCAGNTATTSQTVTIEDNTAPTFTSVPGELLLECDQEVPDVNATATDTCDDEVTVTHMDYTSNTPWRAIVDGGDGSVDLSALPNGFTATSSDDQSGDSFIAVAMTTVKAVTLTFDFDFTTIDDGFEYLIYIVNGEEFFITDTDGAGQVNIDLLAGDQFSFGVRTEDSLFGNSQTVVTNINFELTPLECPITDCFIREFTAVDCAGNESYAQQFVYFQDTTDPVISGVEPGFTVECPEGYAFSMPTVTDNCDAEATITPTDVQDLDECGLGTITRTWVASDACGNTATASQTITIIDVTAPTISGVEAGFTVECPEGYEFSMPTASDLCDNASDAVNFNAASNWLAFMSVQGPEGGFAQGWGVPDAVAIVNVEDNNVTLKPNRVNAATDDTFWFADPADFFGKNTMTASTYVEDNSLTGTSFSYVGNVSDYSLDNGYSVSVFIRVFQAGFQNLLEISAPISETGDFSVSYDGAYEGAAIVQYGFQMVGLNVNPTEGFNAAYDALGSVVITAATIEESNFPTLTFNDVNDLDDCGLGSITRTWTATDCAGNTSNASQTITIIDETAPVIEGVEESFTVQCPDEYAFSEPTASDTCNTGGISFDCVFEGGPLTVTFAAPTGEDENGYEVYGVSIFSTVQGDHFLIFNSEANRWEVIFNGGVIWFSDVATTSPSCSMDDWSVPQGIFCELIEVTCLPGTAVTLTSNDVEDLDECGLGTITRTWTATDCAGNTSNASQTVTIEDTTAPVFTSVPADILQECDLEVAVEMATATDTCDDEVTVTHMDYTSNTPWRAIVDGGDGSVDLSALPNGFTATSSDDQSGDSFIAVAMTTVKAVTLTFDFDFTTIDDGFEYLIYIVNGEEFFITDTDGAGQVNIDLLAGDQFSFGVRTDDSIFGNSQTVVTNINFELTPLECPIKECFIREYTAVDCAGNESYAQQFIVLQDTTAPTLLEGAELPKGESNLNLCYDDRPLGPTEEEVAALYEDNCGTVEVMKTDKPLGDDCDWAVMYTYTVKDDCGNALEPFKVYYNGGDTEGPTLNEGFEYPAPVTGLQCKDDEAIMEPKADDFSAYFGDNCSSAIIGEPVMAMTGDDCDWTVTYTLSVEDACGNPADPIVVSYSGGDTIAPEYQGGLPLGENQLNLCFDETYEGLGEPTEAEVALLFTDNCLDVITAENITKIRKEYTDEDNPNCSWIVVYEYYATDACNNSSEILKVNYQGGDTEAPTQEACVNELITLKTENGAVCPADAGFSIGVGDMVQANDNTWTVAGIPLSQIGSGNGMVGCFSDNCTADGDLKFMVTDTSTPDFGGVDVCETRMTITFTVLDECGNEFPDFTCTFDVIDNTAPVIECPADVVDLGANPTLNVNGIPTDVATKLAANDECQGATEADFDANLDQIASSVSQTNDFIQIVCPEANSTWNYVKTGYDEDGYAMYVVSDFVNYPGSSATLSWNSETNVFETILNNDISPSWITEANGFYPSCDINDWTVVNNGSCTLVLNECGSGSGTEDWTLSRTYFANDGCGNTSSCTVNYAWTIEDQGSQTDTQNGGPLSQYADRIDGSTTGSNTSGPELGATKALDFRAYPVPFDKEVTISYDFDYDTDVRIELYDTKGILIKDLSANRHSRGFTSKTTIDLSGMPNQMFYVKVTTNQGSVIKKIVSKSNRR